MFKTAKSLVILTLVVLFGEIRCFKSSAESKKDVLDHILPKNPNEILVAPGNGTDGSPLAVQVFVHLKGIDKVNDVKMELSSRIIVRQIWEDPRLRYNHDQIDSVVLNDANVIWTPDIYFTNLVKGVGSDVMRPTTYLRIFANGTVLYSKWLSLTTTCPMDLKRFPFDYQTCTVVMSTYGNSYDDLMLAWKNRAPVTISKNVYVGSFTLEKFLTHANIERHTTLLLTLVFRRSLLHSIIRVFMPCTMMVLLSWIPFWMDRKKLTTRLLLGLSALLTTTILVNDYNKIGAQLSYSTMMDCFTGTNLTFLLAAIMESTIVYILGEETNSSIGSGVLKVTKKRNKLLRKLSQNVDKIDFCARYFIPTAYLAFCVIYFCFGIANDTIDPNVDGNYTITWLKN